MIPAEAQVYHLLNGGRHGQRSAGGQSQRDQGNHDFTAIGPQKRDQRQKRAQFLGRRVRARGSSWRLAVASVMSLGTLFGTVSHYQPIMNDAGPTISRRGQGSTRLRRAGGRRVRFPNCWPFADHSFDAGFDQFIAASPPPRPMSKPYARQ